MICADCIRKLHPMYPQRYVQKKGGKGWDKDEPLAALSLDEAKAGIDGIPEYIDGLRTQYGYRSAVIAVDSVRQEKGGFLKPPVLFVQGRVLYGDFDPEDEVTVVHGGSETKTKILDSRSRAASSDYWGSGTHLWGGSTCEYVQFSQKGLEIQAGDLIVK